MKTAIARARGVPPEAGNGIPQTGPDAAKGAIWRIRKQSTDCTDYTDRSDDSDCPDRLTAQAAKSPPAWTAGAGGGPVFLPAIIGVCFSKRTPMMDIIKPQNIVFPEENENSKLENAR